MTGRRRMARHVLVWRGAMRGALLVLLVGAAASTAACGVGRGGEDQLDAGDAQPYDGGPDLTTDGDADNDADSDVDVDADADEGPPSSYEGINPDDGSGRVASCGNGVDDDIDGLPDCEDLGCRWDPSCCVEVDRSWISGDFGACDELQACGWSPFYSAGDGAAAVRLEGDWVRLGGDGAGEVGLSAQGTFDLTGEPTLSMVASLTDPTCDAGRCDQSLGIAFTGQEEVTAGTGVRPLAGLVLQGEAGQVLFYVGGALESSVSAARLGEPRGYALRVLADGRVGFWADLPVADGQPASVDGVAPVRLSDGIVPPWTGGVRAVVFARLGGADAARVRDVALDRLICDAPAGWGDAVPVLTRPGGAVRSPAVIRRPAGDGFLMAFELDSQVRLATSADGETWVEEPSAVPTPVADLVAARSPALLYWPGQDEPYRMWIEAELEGGESVIVSFVSPDGIAWEPNDPDSLVAVPTAAAPSWRAAVGQPAVVLLPAGAQGDVERLRMYFVGRDRVSGATSIGTASSTDGKQWVIDLGPVTLASAEGDASGGGYEADGVAEPAVIVRGAALHMWYTGLSGARATVVYAVSALGSGIAWQRFGPVLDPRQDWEADRVSAPAVVSVPGSGSDPDSLRLWYQAGPMGAERVGLVSRDVPPLSD